MKALRHALLELHKALIESERVALEREHGRLNPHQMWKLLVEDPALAWLRSLSEVIVRIDEALDGAALDEAELREFVRALLVADPAGSEFHRRYGAALQADPAVVLTHRAVMSVL